MKKMFTLGRTPARIIAHLFAKALLAPMPVTLQGSFFSLAQGSML